MTTAHCLLLPFLLFPICLMKSFATKWFIVYFIVLGVLALSAGAYLLIKTGHFKSYLLQQAESGQPPPAIRNILKYFFLFTIPGLILSFVPFSWVKLLFSLWSLMIIYVIGIRLVYWEETRNILLQPDQTGYLNRYIRASGAILLAVSLVMFMLGYLELSSLGLE